MAIPMNLVKRNGELFWEIPVEFILIADILAELSRAEQIHPKWPTDPIHAAAILAEEAGEVVKAVNDVAMDHKRGSDYKTEAIQCAAMCIRFLKNLDKYEWKIGE